MPDFEVYGYRTSSRFGSRLHISIDKETATVTGPRAGAGIYRLWIVLQLILLLSTVPLLITALVLWSWLYLVIALAVFLAYYGISSIGAIALWEYQTAAFPQQGFQSITFPLSAVRDIKIGRGWSRNWIWLVILPFVVPINKLSEGLVVSFEITDKKSGKDIVFALLTSSRQTARSLANLLEAR